MLTRRPLGRTGLLVSPLSLGTVEIGLSYGLPGADPGLIEEPAAARLLHHALDHGINFLDTARAYGLAEERIGRALAHRRAEFVLVSKTLTFSDRAPSTPELARLLGESLATSLRLLSTDHLDILMLHSASAADLESGRLAELLEPHRQAGRFRFLGASTYGEPAALAALADGRFDCLQIAHSALDRRLEARLFAAAAGSGVALIGRSVLLKGALSPRYRDLPPALHRLRAAVAALEPLAADLPGGLPELGFRYALSHAQPESILIGTAHPAELDAALAFAARGPLPAATLAAIAAQPPLSEAELNPGLWPA